MPAKKTPLKMSGSSKAFSNDGVDVISKKIESYSSMEAGLLKEGHRDLRQYYEVKECSTFIKAHNFQKIALQFPDFLLPDATKVTSELQQKFPEKQFFVLGDTSYGSCCVDEVAAEHALADCIIHFGRSCLTQTKRLPVLYIFGKEPIDVDHCVESFKTLFPSNEDRILVLYDTIYSHCIDEVKDLICGNYSNCIVSRLLLPDVIQLPPPPARSHDLLGTTKEDVRTHTQSSIELPTRELCCSSCGKAGTGSCSSSKGSDVVVSEKQDVESGERESKSLTQSLEKATNDLDVTATDKKSGEGDATSLVDAKFSNKDDVVSQDRTEAKVAEHTIGDSALAQEVKEDDYAKTNTKDGILLQESSPVETDTQVTSEAQLHSYARFGRSFRLSSPMEEYRVFYIGMEGASLNNLMLNYNKCQFYSYDPRTKESRREGVSVNKALGRRYFLVQKAKEAKTVGILVGTLGAADYLAIIERLKQLLKDAGKKYYTVAVGKLNVPKMANFLEIDIYVLVACPENSLIDSREFYKPVITPFEMELACMRSREWSGDFTTSFQDLLPGGAFHVLREENANDKDDEEPEYSLITGGLIPGKQNSQEVVGSASSAVVQRSKMEVALEGLTGAQFLHGRSWRGLEQKLGETEVSEPVEGRTGLPVSYSHEHEHKTRAQ